MKNLLHAQKSPRGERAWAYQILFNDCSEFRISAYQRFRCAKVAVSKNHFLAAK